VTLQLNTVNEVTQELAVNVPGVGKACQALPCRTIPSVCNTFAGGAGELQHEH